MQYKEGTKEEINHRRQHYVDRWLDDDNPYEMAIESMLRRIK